MPRKDEPQPPRRVRPSAPPPTRPQYPTPARRSEPARSREMPVIEDDDAVLVPAPAPSVFAAHVAGTRAAPPPSLFFRRTMIPILLTSGVMLAALGGLWFTLDRDAPLRASGSSAWLPATLFSIAAVMLFLAILNMLQVRHLMRAAAAAAVSAARTESR